MKKTIYYAFWTICMTISACEYKYGRLISTMTNRSEYEADRTYHRKSKITVYYDSIHTRRLIFKGFDTLMLEDNGKIKATMFKLKRKKLPETGEKESPHRIYEGFDLKYSKKSIRITVENVKENKPTLMTSEIMDGEYDPAADSIWTYYKYKNVQ
jgi:hypothetical protein